MKAADLLTPYTDEPIPDVAVSHLTNDSRCIDADCLFLAACGLSSHALDHLSEAQYQQTVVIAYQPPYDLSRFSEQQKFIAVNDLDKHISAIGQRFYAPQFRQPLIAVTGTNGKTSVTQFIAQLSDYGVIGTMGYGRPEQLHELSHTTPDALSVPKILATLSDTCSGAALEVSSHALSLHRVDGIDFGIAVFTNLSQDHLDFHHNMAAYYAAKAQLFAFDSVKTAIINTDDDAGYRLAQDVIAAGKRVIAFGRLSRVVEFHEYVNIGTVSLSKQGIACDLLVQLHDLDAAVPLQAPIWGAFNVDNLLAAVLALYAVGESFEGLLNKLPKQLRGVTGRIEAIDLGEQKTAIIDYSHTPDALVNVLSSLRAHTEGKLYALFGCGGDRDKSKRPLMAEAVNLGANVGIITDDNPRTEASADIIDDILTANIARERFHVIPSRRDAIRFGLSQLDSGDTLLIAGKGHETYQIIGTEKIHFSDHEVVQEWLAEQQKTQNKGQEEQP